MIARMSVSPSRRASAWRGAFHWSNAATPPARTTPSRIDCNASSSDSNTLAGPLNSVPSLPEIFATAPSAAKFPYRIAK